MHELRKTAGFRSIDVRAVIALGGWRFDPLTPELARDLAKSGIQVLYIDIPYQGQRVPRGKKPG